MAFVPTKVLVLITITITTTSAMYSLSEFTPFGDSTTDIDMFSGFEFVDDASRNLSFPENLPFFDSEFNSTHVCSNGFLDFSPSPFEIQFCHYERNLALLAGDVIIFGYWVDIVVLSGVSHVWARATNEEHDVAVETLSANVRKVFNICFHGRMAVVITYELVAIFGATQKRLTFQINVVTDGASTFAFLYYNDLDGEDEGLAGFQYTPIIKQFLPGYLSATSSDIQNGSNVGKTGAWALALSNGFSIAGTLNDADLALPPPDFCSSAGSGNNPHPTCCNMFITCPDAHTHFCPLNQNFEPDEYEVCVWNTQYSCEEENVANFCQDKDDGLYNYPGDCTKFISCSGKLTHPMDCPIYYQDQKLHFKYVFDAANNMHTGYCEYPVSAGCTP